MSQFGCTSAKSFGRFSAEYAFEKSFAWRLLILICPVMGTVAVNPLVRYFYINTFFFCWLTVTYTVINAASIIYLLLLVGNDAFYVCPHRPESVVINNAKTGA